MAMTNSTGCSSVWGSTYPYNPYPFPWVNHLFQDAPSIAIGIFERHMRKMGDNFMTVRKAELLLNDEFDEAETVVDQLTLVVEYLEQGAQVFGVNITRHAAAGAGHGKAGRQADRQGPGSRKYHVLSDHGDARIRALS